MPFQDKHKLAAKVEQNRHALRVVIYIVMLVVSSRSFGLGLTLCS
jgi:hypothetical protein